MKLTTKQLQKGLGIKKALLSIFILLANAGISHGQMMEPKIKMSKHIFQIEDSITDNCIRADLIRSDSEYFEVRISNSSTDTIYLFDSYFGENLYESTVLHRYDSKSNECILSFLPIPYYVVYQRSDLVVVGKSRVASEFQVTYEFEAIEPFSYVTLLIPKDCFDYDYVEDYNLLEMNRFVKPNFTKVNQVPNCLSKKMVFATYKNVEWFNEEAYCSISIYDTASKEYDILSVDVR